MKPVNFRIEHEIAGLMIQPGQNLKLYVSNEQNERIGFINVCVTENEKIMVFTNDERNEDQKNVIHKQWQSHLEYVKEVKEVENME